MQCTPTRNQTCNQHLSAANALSLLWYADHWYNGTWLWHHWCPPWWYNRSIAKIVKCGNAGKCREMQMVLPFRSLPRIHHHKGIKPQLEKIQGILNMKQPTTQKEVHHFLGMDNFYRDLYLKQAETLAPLISLCGQNKKFYWSDEQSSQENKWSNGIWNHANLSIIR